MTRNAVAALIALMIGGCAASVPVPRTAAFTPSEFAPYDSPGASAIEGQAFAKTRSGDVKYAAGDSIYLCPVTSYSEEWYSKGFTRAQTLEPGDPRFHAYVRAAVADGQGRFRFERLPAGKYFVTCRLSWEPDGRGIHRAEVNLGSRCEVRDGQEINVILLPVSGRNSPFESWKILSQE